MKKRFPKFEDEYLFTLPGHIKGSGAALAALEQVPSAPGVCIRRWPERPPRLAMALAPNTAEQVRLAAKMRDAASETGEDVPQLVSTAYRALAQLAGMARKGNGKALWQFASLVAQCCEGLGQMTAADPAAMRPLARQMARWPMMMSTHPLNCDPLETLDAIELGKGAKLTLDRYSKWKPGTAAQYAYDLYAHLQFIRTEDNPKVNGKSFSEILPEFSRDTASLWWDWAWHFLLYTYPHPEQVAELDRLVTAPSKRKSPGRRKLAIHDILKARFIVLALP